MPDDGPTAASPPRLAPHAHARAVTLVHTSDVHIGTGHKTEHDDEWPERALADLARTAQLGRDHGAQLLCIVGDFFDNNRVRESLVAATAEALARAALPTVILPGNHDPYMPESVYVRFRDLFPPNVHILQREDGELLPLPEVGVQVWGQAHTDYYDFNPVEHAPPWVTDGPEPLWRIALAHGYYVKSEYETRMSYQIHPHDLVALDAHYVGLGHLELHEPVGPPGVTAYYAGAPDRSGGATIVDLTPGGISVRHVKSGVPPAGADPDAGDGFFPPGTQ